MNFVHLDRVYRAMLATPDAAERARLFEERALQPLRAALYSPYMPLPEDATLHDRARAMQWRMPDDLTSEPPGLADLEAARAWERGEAALRESIARFARYAHRAPFETEITGSIVLTHAFGPGSSDGGYAGYQSPGCVVVTYHAPSAANAHFAAGALAHEYNHRVRLAAFPWDMAAVDVAEYVVMEGLAEAFAVAVCGEEALGYYVTHVTGDDLERARALVRAGWRSTGFGTLRSYVFGDGVLAALAGTPLAGNEAPIGMPDYGGYAVGYHVVRAYLERTGTSIEEATFTHPHTILTESGWLA
jgi:uncharacterized protein YjaZ